MRNELCTTHTSIDAARARILLQEAKDDIARLSQIYSDCFFDGSVAAAESAVQFALKTTHSAAKAVELADTLKSLPTAIPVWTAQPLARICAFLAISFPEEECRAPLNTCCYAESFVKREALRAVLGQLHDVLQKTPDKLEAVLGQIFEFFEGLMHDSEELDRHIAIRRLVGLTNGKNSQVRKGIFRFLLALDSRESSTLLLKANGSDLEDYDDLLTSQLTALATDTESMVEVTMRCLARSLQLGTISSLVTLWTYHRAQVMQAVPMIGKDCFLYLLMAHGARLAFLGNMSACRHAIGIAHSFIHSRDAKPVDTHEAIRSALITLCTSIGAASSACGDEDTSRLVAEILRYLRSLAVVSNTVTAGRRLLEKIRHTSLASQRWGCPRPTALLTIILRTTEMWESPMVMQKWIKQGFSALIDSSTRRDETADSVTNVGRLSSSLIDERINVNADLNDSFGVLILSLGVSIFSHPSSHVRFAVVESLRNISNTKCSLFCLPGVLMHLQLETNGVVAVYVIRDLLCSKSLLQQKETCQIVLNACMHSLGQFKTKDSLNSTIHESTVVTLGYATEHVAGLAISLLLREIENFTKSFGLTRGPARAAAAAATLKLVQCRPSRGTALVPFISLCIAPESMVMAPEATSICFEAMSVMAEEEVLDPVKAVKIVMKNYPEVLEVDPKARKSYLRLVGQVSKGSRTKKGKLLAKKVVRLLRRVLEAANSKREDAGESPACTLSWEEVGQTAKSLGMFTVEEILRLAHADDEPLLDLEAEAERKEAIEKECQGFVHLMLSLTALVHNAQPYAATSLRQLLVKIVSHEWENRKRSSFDPDRIARLQAASDALRRARQAKDVTERESETNIHNFAKAVKGLPTGVMKGVLSECVWNAAHNEEHRKKNCFWIATRTIIASKALSPALPWIGLITETLLSSRSSGEERASCFAVLRALPGDNFELKEACRMWFGSQSPLFDSSVPNSVSEASELFLGMIQFYPTEIVDLLFRYKGTICSEALLNFIRACRKLQGKAVSTAARGLFPAVLQTSEKENVSLRHSVEKEFYDIILSNCEATLIEELLLNCITEAGAVRIASMARVFPLLKEAARCLLAQGNEEDLLGIVGLAIRSFDFAHRRDFVLDVCSNSDDEDLRKRQHWLAAHVFGVAALLPYTDLALSVAVSFCPSTERDLLHRTLASIRQ